MTQDDNPRAALLALIERVNELTITVHTLRLLLEPLGVSPEAFVEAEEKIRRFYRQRYELRLQEHLSREHDASLRRLLEEHDSKPQ